ncbi:MAG TPA: M1 family aminopeptidase [Terriglobales bacterium]|nr:M1 family aminopeptidase [Terriglobales bacterium]
MNTIRRRLLPLLPTVLATAAMAQGWGQAGAGATPLSVAGGAPQIHSGPAEALYLQLRGVRLDKSRVYRVRAASLDRAALHITLNDGTLAFTEDVAGRVTGAFFEGDGEVLLMPPDQVERASMSLFTGAAILEEKFLTAYFRFNDDTFRDLQPLLRPGEHAEEFVEQWNETAHNLAEGDALELLIDFSRFLPGPGGGPPASVEPPADAGRILHARVENPKLGVFDLYYDSAAPEQVWAGQLKTVAGGSYYDVWTSFSPRKIPAGGQTGNGVLEQGSAEGIIDVSSYKIRTEIKPPTDIYADATLQLHVLQGGHRALLFELSQALLVQKVEADGHPVEFIHNPAVEGSRLARRGNDLVAVVFPEPLKAGQRMELRFVYGGPVLSEAGGGLMYVGARGIWYPNRGIAMSDFDLEFHYPTGWSLLATGKRQEIPSGINAGPDAKPGEQVSRWISERAMPLAGFNLGKYTRAQARTGTISVEAYAGSEMERTFPSPKAEEDIPMLPGHPDMRPRALPATTVPPSPAHNAQLVADESARAIDFFSHRFGPYPYPSAGLALTQMPGTASQGWPGLIYLSSFSFLTKEQKSQLHMSPVNEAFSNQVIAHETAHQWWGDLVSWSSYHDQWMMEALANYSSFMMLERENPVEFRLVMDKYRDDLLQKNADGIALMEAGPVTFGSRLSCSKFPNGYEAISYGRGTWLFHMLRYMMLDAERKTGTHGRAAKGAPASDEPFVRALKKFRVKYQGKVATTQDLFAVFEEELPPSLQYEGKKSLDWFYQGWVNGTSIPSFELHEVKYAAKAESTTVTGVIMQKSASDNLVTSVPVYASVAGKNVLLGRVFADGPETAFRLAAPPGTHKVVLDPHQTVLARIH